MDEWAEIRQAIVNLVDEAAGFNVIVESGVMAAQIARKFPNTNISVWEIRNQIIIAASRAGLAVQITDPPK